MKIIRSESGLAHKLTRTRLSQIGASRFSHCMFIPLARLTSAIENGDDRVYVDCTGCGPDCRFFDLIVGHWSIQIGCQRFSGGSAISIRAAMAALKPKAKSQPKAKAKTKAKTRAAAAGRAKKKRG